MFWLVLGLFVVLYPLFPRPDRTLWYAHVLAVAAMAALCVPRFWRTRELRVGVPLAATVVALLSLALAVRSSRGEFPVAEMGWASVTALAHGLCFLLALGVTPAAAAQEASGRATRRALGALLLSLLIVQGVAVLAQDKPGEGVWRANGTYGNPNALGALVAAGALALAAFAGWRRRVVLALFPFVPLVLATRSRGVVAATALVLLVFLARLSLRRALAVTLAGLLALALIPNPLLERLQGLKPEHVFPRALLWERAAGNVVAHPAGIGPGMNKYVFPATARMDERPWLIHQRHEVGLTHNVLLTLTLEWGWLAGAAALGLLVWSARRLWARGPPDRLGQGAALGASVLFLELQVDAVEQNPMAFSVFLVLLAVALRRSGPAPRGWPVSGRLAAAGLALVALALLGQAWERAGVERALGRARAALAAYQEGRQDAAITGPVLAWVEKQAPLEPEAPLLRFEFQFAQARALVTADDQLRDSAAWDEHLALAREAMGRARRAHPADPHLPRREAWLTLRERRAGGPRANRAFSDYFRAMRRVLELDPLDVRTRWDLAFEAYRAGRFALMDEQLGELFRLEPDYARAWAVMGFTFEAEGQPERALYHFVRAQEALVNCRILAAVASPRSRAFYLENLEAVDLVAVRTRITALRRRLFL